MEGELIHKISCDEVPYIFQGIKKNMFLPHTHSLSPRRQGSHSLETFRKGANTYSSVCSIALLHEHTSRLLLVCVVEVVHSL